MQTDAAALSISVLPSRPEDGDKERKNEIRSKEARAESSADNICLSDGDVDDDERVRRMDASGDGKPRIEAFRRCGEGSGDGYPNGDECQ